MPARQNPFSTGSEMKDAMKPSRNIPASRPRIPVTMARAAVSATYRVPSPPANGATLAADSAAVADIGPTTRCRELPAAGVQDQRRDRRMQAHRGWHAGNGRVCQGFGYQDRPDRQPGNHIRADPDPA